MNSPILIATYTAKDVCPTIGSIGIANLRTGTKVGLQFFAGFDFHTPKDYFVMGAERLDELIDRPVHAVEPMVGHQVLLPDFASVAPASDASVGQMLPRR